MITHEQMMFCIQRIHPQITVHDHGRKYFVGMPVSGDQQIGEAFIMDWRFNDIEQPSFEEIMAVWNNSATQTAYAEHVAKLAIPTSVSWRQANLAMLEVGKLADVEALIQGIADPVEKRKAEIEFNSPVYERSSAFLRAMWAQVGGTDAQLDDLFVLASQK